MTLRPIENNPLARTAQAVPPIAGLALSYGGRAAGVILAILVIGDQAYDRTQVFAGVVIAIALASMLPILPRTGGWLPWLGAGAVFFGGALLASIDLGMAMIPAGAVAAIGAALVGQNEGRSIASGLSAFFISFGLLMALVFLVIIQAVEG